MGSSSKWSFPGKNKFKGVKFVIFLKHAVSGYGMCSTYFYGEKNLTGLQRGTLLELALLYAERIFRMGLTLSTDRHHLQMMTVICHHHWHYMKLQLSSKSCPFCLIFFYFNVYLFLKERDRARVDEEQREGDRESEAGSRLWAVSTEPDAGLELMNHEIMTWAEVRCSIDWATQVPQFCLFLSHA